MRTNKSANLLNALGGSVNLEDLTTCLGGRLNPSLIAANIGANYKNLDFKSYMVASDPFIGGDSTSNIFTAEATKSLAPRLLYKGNFHSQIPLGIGMAYVFTVACDDPAKTVDIIMGSTIPVSWGMFWIFPNEFNFSIIRGIYVGIAGTLTKYESSNYKPLIININAYNRYQVYTQRIL